MILSMSNQAIVFLTTVIIGFFVGFVYDLFRVFRKTVPHANLITSLEDMVYWLFVSLVMFYVMLNNNYGEIRFFTIVGVFLGMLLYFMTVSRLFMMASLTILRFVKKILMLIFEIIMTPFRLLYRLLLYPIRFLEKKWTKFYAEYKKLLHKFTIYAKIKERKIKRDIGVILKKT